MTEKKADAKVEDRTAKGTPPKTGAEAGGGVVEEGTGDFAPGKNADDTSKPAPGVDTVTMETATGDEVEVEVGMDGESPVTPQNPPRKAALGGGAGRPGENPDTGKQTVKGQAKTKAKAQ